MAKISKPIFKISMRQTIIDPQERRRRLAEVYRFFEVQEQTLKNNSEDLKLHTKRPTKYSRKSKADC